MLRLRRKPVRLDVVPGRLVIKLPPRERQDGALALFRRRFGRRRKQRLPR